MEGNAQPPVWKVLLAFAIIYIVWRSTFLAIRVGVREVPPFLLAGMRFPGGWKTRIKAGLPRVPF